MSDLDLPFIPAAEHGGPFNVPAHIRVIHSTEGPMSPGNARALAVNWFGRSEANGGAGTSAHDIFDPSGGILMVPADHIAWHCGPGGNGFTRGSEHCGSVALSREQWLSPDGQAMLDHSARYNAAAARRDGVLPRWLTLTQLAAREPGFCTHNDIRLVFGGTTHSDPGPNFPYDWYMNRVRFYYDGGNDDMPNTPEQLEQAAYKAITRYEQERHATGQPTPQEAYQSTDDIVRKLDAIAADLHKVLDALTAPAGK